MAVVNITPNAASKGLKEKLEEQARLMGVGHRTLVARIYEYAVRHKREFSSPLRKAGESPGNPIGAPVDEQVAKALTAWAKERGTARGIHCRYILEKAIEMDLSEKLFKTTGE